MFPLFVLSSAFVIIWRTIQASCGRVHPILFSGRHCGGAGEHDAHAQEGHTRAAEQEGAGDEARLVFITHVAREADVQATVAGLRKPKPRLRCTNMQEASVCPEGSSSKA